MAFVYEEIKNTIKSRIQSGIYKPSDKLPSERMFAEEFSVSRMTVRQAIKGLELEGLISREKGKGTFVSSYQFSQRNLKSFTETLKGQGYAPSTIVLEVAVVHHLGDIATKMGVPKASQFYKIKRIRLGDEVPIALETIYIPRELCYDIDQQDLTKSLYNVIKDEYDIDIEWASYNIGACISNKVLMRYFEIERPVVLLKVEGITYDTEGKELMYEESYYRSDLYSYQVDIYKRGK